VAEIIVKLFERFISCATTVYLNTDAFIVGLFSIERLSINQFQLILSFIHSKSLRRLAVCCSLAIRLRNSMQVYLMEAQ